MNVWLALVAVVASTAALASFLVPLRPSRGGGEQSQGVKPKGRWPIGVGVAAILAMGAVSFYAALGGDTSAGQSDPTALTDMRAAAAFRGMGFSSSPQKKEKRLPDVDTLMTRLAERLKTAPNDPKGWRMLGWSYFETENYDEAVKAYAHAVKLKPGDARYQSAYGEALVMAAGDKMTAEAGTAFQAALTLSPNDPRARYYVGLAKSRKGDTSGAIADWIAAIKAAPASSPWAARLRSAVEKLASRSGVDVSGMLPPVKTEAMPAAAPPQPTVQQVRQAEAMAPQDRQAMIAGMVDRLDKRLRANPDDADGWIRLIRARRVLGQGGQAREALSRALRALSQDAAAKQKIVAAAGGLGVTLN